MKRDETVYLRHILDAIDRVEEYLTDVEEANFHEQYLIQEGSSANWKSSGRLSYICLTNCGIDIRISPGKILLVHAIN